MGQTHHPQDALVAGQVIVGSLGLLGEGVDDLLPLGEGLLDESDAVADGTEIAGVVEAGVGAALARDEQQGVAILADSVKVSEDALAVRARL